MMVYARVLLGCLGFLLGVQLRVNGDINDLLANYSETIHLDDMDEEKLVEKWRNLFTDVFEADENYISDSLICDVIRSSSMLISNTLKVYFSTNRGHTVHTSNITSVCPWSTTLLKLLCTEFNLFSKAAIMKPICKDSLNPLQYAVKLHNIDAVRFLLQHFAPVKCNTYHDCELVFHLAAVNDRQLVKLLMDSDLLTAENIDTICKSYSTTYYICALGLGCETYELIQSYLYITKVQCSLDQPPIVIDTLLSQDLTSIDDITRFEAVSSGGWHTSESHVNTAGITTQCDIPIIDYNRLHLYDFATLEHMSIPVLIKGGMHGSVLFDEWTRFNLKGKYGHLEVKGGSIPYGEVFGEFNGVSTIDEFLEYMSRYNAEYHKNKSSLPLYIFDSIVIPEHFAAFVGVPDKLQVWNATLIYQFIMGPKGSGAPFHFHCSALNSLVYGRKRWYIYPPGNGYYSKIHPLKWDHDGKQLQCVQCSGDIIFVPSGWSHSTVNIEDGIGHAIEFDTSDC